MAEEIIIGKLIVDTSDLNTSMADSKKAIIDLENEQKKLKKDTDGLTAANEDQLQSFVNNELELKKLKAEYSANQKSVLEFTKAQTGLDNALKANITTQEQAKKNTQELTAARQKIDATTLDGAKAIAQINAKIDDNNKFVAANGSAQEKASNITGNYRQKIFELGGAFGGSTAQAIGFVQQGKQILGTVGEIGGMVTNSAKSIVGFGNASKVAAVQAAQMSTTNTVLATTTEAVGVAEQGTTKATIGLNIAIGTLLLPITAIVVTLGLIVAVFRTFQPLVDKVEQGVAALTATFNVIKNTILAVVNGAKSLKEAFSGLGGEMSKAAGEAAALTKAQQDLDDAMASQEVATARNRAEINKLNVELKNRTKTEAERLAISDKIISKENADFQQRKKIVDEEIRIARQAIATKAQFSEREKKLLKEQGDATKELAESRGGNYDKEFEALNKARLKAINLEDEVTVNLEKTYSRRDKINDDAASKNEARLAKQQAASEKARESGLRNLQNEIDILKLQSEQRNLSTKQQIENAQKVFDLENALAQKSLSGSDQTKKLIENRQNLSSAILEITDSQISKELEAQKVANEKSKATTQEQFDAQKQSAEDLATAQLLLLNKKLLSEKAVADETVKIEQAKNEALLLIDTNAAAAKKLADETAATEAKALQDVLFQIRLQDIQDRDAAEQEVKQALLQEQYNQELILLDQSLADKAISQGVYDQKLMLAQKKFNAETTKNDKILNAQKRAETERTISNGLNALGELFEGSKAIAVASALFNTYQGITAELSTKAVTPYEIGLKVANVAFVAAAGFAAVKNILKTNKGDSSVGDTSTARPVTTSGTGSFVNTAQTETVARVSDTPQQTNTVVTPPVLILETLQEAQNNLSIKVNSN
jgi:hypothetical protein